jgi:hypothetical protein
LCKATNAIFHISSEVSHFAEIQYGGFFLPEAGLLKTVTKMLKFKISTNSCQEVQIYGHADP